MALLGLVAHTLHKNHLNYPVMLGSESGFENEDSLEMSG